jgi:pyruvate dehydrogenase E2 component (dihydrolipoamide acetyltransferase)
MPTIKLPQAGKTMQTGTVRKWLKKPGEAVAQGEVVAEIETEEGLLQLESPLAGQLNRILVGDGKTVVVHEALGEIGDAPPLPTSIPPPPVTPAPSLPTATRAAGTEPPSDSGKVIPILMPKAGQTMEEGTVLKWHVQPGARINKGDVIFEVETDKANMDVEATDSGRLARIVVAEGGLLPVLQPVAFLAEKDADVDAFLASLGSGTASTGITAQAQVLPPTTQPLQPRVTAPVARSESGRVKASPAARKIAQERGIDLSALGRGSGPGGRLLSSDVPLTAVPVATPRRRMSQMRRAIARNLLLSKQTIPHFYIRLTVDADPVLSFYKAQKAQYPCSVTDVLVLACARLIQEFPPFRSRLEGEEIIESPASHIGVAVGMDEGLVVPVLLGAERLNLQQIGSETRRLAAAARSGKLEGVGQGVFTITNLGMFGTEEFAAIINPPEAAILAVGATRETVIVKEGALRPGRIMTLTLSADHRIIDGLVAARFLARLKEMLEAPEKLPG